MEAPRLLYGGPAVANFDGVLLQNQRVMSPSSKEPIIGSVFVPGGSTSFFGTSSMFSFRSVNGDKKSERSFFDTFDQDENEAEDLDEYFHQPGKKRRLTVDQVQFLEKNFGEENKLEPERKVQLAKELGLQPRQIAIWFQNRRARWKTKQLEKDYDALRNRYDNLKSDYDNLVKEKENLRAEVLRLTDELLVKDKEKVELALRDVQKDSDALPKGTMSTTNPIWEDELSNASAMALKQQLQQEDLSSAKSDVFDSESPRYADGVHSSFLDQGDSSYVFEPAHSDISQDDDEKFDKNLLPIDNFLDQAEHDPVTTSSNYFRSFPVEDHGFGFWSC